MTTEASTTATTTDAPLNPAHPSDFAELVRTELQLDATDELYGKTWLEKPPRQLFGVALSGGGIRSATFNLGLLQGLHERGMLPGFDYLATVSGGGYTGAFWTQWRRLHPGKIFPDSAAANSAEPHEIGHLRRFSNFLSPTLGVFNFDTGRVIIALINAIIPSVVGALSFLALLLCGSIVIAALVLIAPGLIATHVLPPWTWRSFDIATAIGAFLCMGVFGAAHFVVMFKMWSESIDKRLIKMTGVVLVLVLAALWAVLLGRVPQLTHDAMMLFSELGTCNDVCTSSTLLRGTTWLYALAPAIALMLLPAITGLLRVIDEGHISVRPTWAAVADQVNSWYVFAAAAWIVLTAMWWSSFNLYLWATTHPAALSAGSASSIPLVAIVTWLSRKVGHTSRSSESLWQRAGRLAVVVAGYVIVAAMSILMMTLLVHVQHQHWWLYTCLVIALGMLYVMLFYDPNRVGLHDFYRGRIARGFIGASHATGRATDDSTMEQAEDDVRLANLRGPEVNIAGPVHLVVCAANNLTPREPLSSLSRGAESAVLSPVGWSVGNNWVRWPERPPTNTDTWKAESPKLSSAVTASGAAFNTQMGSKSIALGPAMAFVMSSLGLRLGLWLRHPKNVDASHTIVRRRQGSALIEELLGRSDARNGEWVFLSDGGHFDNTGLYELVRRHCRFILMSDCGADAERAFDDLGSAVRRVREDFGVDIKINMEPLKPDDQGFSRQPMVAGDIHYPNGDTGTLLIVKPSLTGSEPPDVLQYRARNAQFPHQSTGDQFFDEAQWESYRRLGLHVARTAFQATSGNYRHPALSADDDTLFACESITDLRMRMARDFSGARREWLARPADFEQRIERLAAAFGGLDALLPHTGALLSRELSWECPPCSTEEPSASVPTGSEYLSALSALRQALVVFESAFLNERLATNFNQPMYSGVMNVMARWMTAPLMHAWWPLLSSTCGAAFRQFAAAQFMVSATQTSCELSTTSRTGALPLASRHRPTLPVSERTSSMRLILTLATPSAPSADKTTQHIEVARLDGYTSEDNTVMVWEGRDLYVPPGLWGMGFGSRMLADTMQHTTRSTGAAIATQHWVLIPSLLTGTPDEKKDSADLQQLYLDAGFTTASAEKCRDPMVQNAYSHYCLLRADRKHELQLPDHIAELQNDPRLVVLMRS